MSLLATAASEHGPSRVLSSGHTTADFVLDDVTRDRLAKAVPANTTRAYRYAWDRFIAWCDEHHRVALPATAETLAAYVSEMITAGLAPATVNHAIDIVHVRHSREGYRGYPDTGQALLLLRGYRRVLAENGVGQRQATPFTVESLLQTIDALDLGTPDGRRDQMLLVFGFQLMSRRSELSALAVDAVEDTPRGLDVHIRTSKTDHNSEGRLTALPPQLDPRVDPVRLIEAWRVEAGPGGLARRTLRGRLSTGSLSGHGINDAVKRAAARADLPNPERYTAHALRAGGFMAALLAGWPIGIAARHGGWDPESPTVLRYARSSDRFEQNAMRGVFG